MDIANTQQDFDRAAEFAKQYTEQVGELYLVLIHRFKRDCANAGEAFDRNRFEDAFKTMSEIVFAKEA